MSSIPTAILLSTFNGEKHLEEHLQSLCSQESQNITLFIRDDGSSDQTKEIVEKFKGNANIQLQILPDERHLGAAKSFFHLLQESGNGFQIYAFADQDDLWLPEKIARAINALSEVSGETPTLYFSRMEYVDEGLRHLRWSRIPRRIGFGNAVVENIATGCTIVMNGAARKLILEHLPEDCIMHDWWCYLTISCYGRIIYDAHAAIKYRLHGGNSIGAPVTFGEDINKRLKRFFTRNGGIFRSSDQAGAFLKSHGESLPQEAREILELVTASKASIRKRWTLVTHDYIWRQRKLDNLILKILILINRF